VRCLLTTIDRAEWGRLATLGTDERYVLLGAFEGIPTSGVPISETFADWYRFENGQVCGRRSSFFLRPPI
jgi:hypothetical protein